MKITLENLFVDLKFKRVKNKRTDPDCTGLSLKTSETLQDTRILVLKIKTL